MRWWPLVLVTLGGCSLLFEESSASDPGASFDARVPGMDAGPSGGDANAGLIECGPFKGLQTLTFTDTPPQGGEWDVDAASYSDALGVDGSGNLTLNLAVVGEGGSTAIVSQSNDDAFDIDLRVEVPGDAWYAEAIVRLKMESTESADEITMILNGGVISRYSNLENLSGQILPDPPSVPHVDLRLQRDTGNAVRGFFRLAEATEWTAVGESINLPGSVRMRFAAGQAADVNSSEVVTFLGVGMSCQ